MSSLFASHPCLPACLRAFFLRLSFDLPLRALPVSEGTLPAVLLGLRPARQTPQPAPQQNAIASCRRRHARESCRRFKLQPCFLSLGGRLIKASVAAMSWFRGQRKHASADLDKTSAPNAKESACRTFMTSRIQRAVRCAVEFLHAAASPVVSNFAHLWNHTRGRYGDSSLTSAMDAVRMTLFVTSAMSRAWKKLQKSDQPSTGSRTLRVYRRKRYF